MAQKLTADQQEAVIHKVSRSLAFNCIVCIIRGANGWRSEGMHVCGVG
jgi:hypothetical protein